MTTSSYLELSRLWQEQTDPLEEATLRRLANDIERTASRRRAIDFAMGLVAIFMTVLALFVHPASLPIKLALAAAIALVLWMIWKREQFLKVARALAALEPRAFFAAAISNARDELNLATFSLLMGAPIGYLILVLLAAPDALGGIDSFVREMLGTHLKKTTAFAATMLPIYLFYIVALGRLRAQVRRLEAMSWEWDAEDADDLTEAP